VGIAVGGIDNVASVADDVVAVADDVATAGGSFLGDLNVAADGLAVHEAAVAHGIPLSQVTDFLHTKTLIGLGDDIARSEPNLGSGLNHELPLSLSPAGRAQMEELLEGLGAPPRNLMMIGSPGVGKTDALRGVAGIAEARGMHVKVINLADNPSVADLLGAPPSYSGSSVLDDVTAARIGGTLPDAGVTVGVRGPLTQSVSEAIPETQRAALRDVRSRAQLREMIDNINADWDRYDIRLSTYIGDDIPLR
jgi:hypothetical protein